VAVLKKGESGVPVTEIIRKYEISRNTYFNWKARYSGAEVSELKRLRELEAYNAQRPNDGLSGLPPLAFMPRHPPTAETSSGLFCLTGAPALVTPRGTQWGAAVVPPVDVLHENGDPHRKSSIANSRNRWRCTRATTSSSEGPPSYPPWRAPCSCHTAYGLLDISTCA